MNAGEMVLTSKRKWFWIGMVIALFLPPVPGLVFGIGLYTEKPYRKEALIIIVWSLVWATCMFFLSRYLMAAQLAPYIIQT